MRPPPWYNAATNRLNIDSLSSSTIGGGKIAGFRRGRFRGFYRRPAPGTHRFPLVAPTAAANASFLAGAPHAEFDLSAFTGKWQELHAQIWAHVQASAEETRALIEELIASAKAAHSKDSRAMGSHDFSADIQAAIDRFNAYVDELFAKVSEHKAEWSTSWSAAHDGAKYEWGFDSDALFADWKGQAHALGESFAEKLDSHTWGSWGHGAERKLSGLEGDHEWTLPAWIADWQSHDWSEKAAEWTAHFDAATLAWSDHVNEAIGEWESHSWSFDWPAFEHDFDFEHNFDFEHDFEFSKGDWAFEGFEVPDFDHDFPSFDFEHDFNFPSFHNNRKLI